MIVWTRLGRSIASALFPILGFTHGLLIPPSKFWAPKVTWCFWHARLKTRRLRTNQQFQNSNSRKQARAHQTQWRLSVPAFILRCPSILPAASCHASVCHWISEKLFRREAACDPCEASDTVTNNNSTPSSNSLLCLFHKPNAVTKYAHQ